MSAESPRSAWFEDFFAGAALELWRNAIPEEKTSQEVEFLCETLEAPEGGSLLDVPCGNGRLSLPIARLKYKVTGVDFSDTFIEEARQAASSQQLKIDFIQDDMRKLSFNKKFDGAFCMGNSFGYFDRADTLDFFKSVNNGLKSGAKFVLDSAMVAECFLVNGGEREWVQVGEMYMLIENNYNCRTSCVETNYTFIQNGKEEKRQALHWIYTAGEICHMLEQSGFEPQDLFGSADFDQFALGDERLLLVAEKQ